MLGAAPSRRIRQRPACEISHFLGFLVRDGPGPFVAGDVPLREERVELLNQPTARTWLLSQPQWAPMVPDLMADVARLRATVLETVVSSATISSVYNHVASAACASAPVGCHQSNILRGQMGAGWARRRCPFA